jgi:hypothetical protein
MDTTDPPPMPATYCSEFAEEAHGLCLLGDMDEDAIAKALDVSVETLREWLATVPEFAEAVRKGGKLADGGAAKGLHKRATGYDHPAAKIFLPARSREPVHATYDRHLPPHPASAMKWLEVRHPQVWGDKGETKAPNSDDVKKLEAWLRTRNNDELWAIVARVLHKNAFRPPDDQG